MYRINQIKTLDEVYSEWLKLNKYTKYFAIYVDKLKRMGYIIY
jgi:hypothetical protein